MSVFYVVELAKKKENEVGAADEQTEPQHRTDLPAFSFRNKHLREPGKIPLK